MRHHTKTAVVGFGNILMGDEGVGVHIIHELQKKYLGVPDNLEFIDGGTSALDVVLSLNNVDKLVIVDAMQGNKKPGDTYEFNYSDVNKLFQSDSEISLHDLNIFESLKIAEKTKILPEKIIFIGIEPKEIVPKIELSKELKEKINNIIEIILGEVNNDSIKSKIS